MARTAPVSGGGNFPVAEAGPQVVRCTQFIDLGTQTSSFEGKQKEQHKILLGFEVIGSDKGSEDFPGPFILWKRFTFSMHEKSALRKFLASWRGKPMTDEEASVFDVALLAEKTVAGLANVVHTEKDGKTFANVDSIMPLPKGMTAAPAATKPVIFDLDDYDHDVFQTFSEHLQKTIKSAPEYLGIFDRKQEFPEPPPAREPGDDDPGPTDDDVAF